MWQRLLIEKMGLRAVVLLYPRVRLDKALFLFYN